MPQVQRKAIPVKATPLRRPAPPGTGGAPLPVAALTPPPSPPSSGVQGSAPAATGSQQSAAASPLAVQRAPWSRSKSSSPAKHQTRHSATGALAAAAAATVASAVGRHTPAAPPATARRSEPPPPYSSHTAGPPPNPPPPYSVSASAAAPPPEYTAVPAGGFDPRELTDFQLDELVHRIIGRITRLIRTELRMDRERIGKLRDPRH
ncbi:hypothetical protein ACIQI8_17425 [Streptomyces sp. NPDC092369]|uniref:hypothetical protein n=1 Tax=Streptomyces sp. NPDC092369 TaxID=3366015 RepID=UPI00381C496F